MKKQKVFLMATIFLISFLLLINLSYAAGEKVSKQPGKSYHSQVILRVDGLACPFCAYGLEKKFLASKKIDSFVVNFDQGSVQIQIKKGEVLTDVDIYTIVREAGYTLKEIKQN